MSDWAGVQGKALREEIDHEIEGKNAAINSYDKTIWAIRSGYLTVVFVMWSLALTSLVGESGLAVGAVPLVYLLAGLTAALSIGAWTLDHSYVRRKFRVIMALDDLMQVALRIATEPAWDPHGPDQGELQRLLKVAGDCPEQPHTHRGVPDGERIDARRGFRQALFPAVVVYLGVPVTFTILALAAKYLLPVAA